VNDRSDVVIIGGGLVGSMAALMLQRRGMTATVLESRGADDEQKIVVGEAITEGSSVFLRHELGFGDWLFSKSYRKFGFDFLVQPRHEGAPEGPAPDQCHELLMSLVPFEKIPAALSCLIPTFHVDRLKMNPALRERAVEAGADLRLQAKVTEVVLGERDHVVHYVDAEGQAQEVGCTWVLDCSGWRGVLPRQLGIRKQADTLKTASVWTRFRGVDDSPATWKSFGGIDRRRQTVHFCGKGFWIWWIHHDDQLTSVGVSYDTEQHQPNRQGPDRGFWEMIDKFPAVRRALEGATPTEPFQGYGHLAHVSEHWVSTKGYAIIGDAGWFVDALYSTAIEAACRQLMAVLPLIQGAVAGQAPPAEEVDKLNEEFTYLQKAVLAHNRFKYHEAWHQPHVLFQVTLYELAEIAELYHLQDPSQWTPENIAKNYRLQWGSADRLQRLEAFLEESRKDFDRDLTEHTLLRKALSPTWRVYLGTWPVWHVRGATPWFFLLTRLWGYAERWAQRYAWMPDLLGLLTPAMPVKQLPGPKPAAPMAQGG
jgi:flavin-dependent dehydrogenase